MGEKFGRGPHGDSVGEARKGRRTSRRIAAGGVAAVGLFAGLSVATAPTALADGPGVGTPMVVTVGDSYISGEAGRWAGNTNNGESLHDAGGSNTYYDNAPHTAEVINRCHRGESSEVTFGGGVNGLNLACSGAKTSTFWSGTNFKPGLDFYDDGYGNKGQAKLLQQAASTNNVKMVVVSIGGNNFNFADIIQTCVSDWLGSSSLSPNYCNDDSSVTSNFTSGNVTTQTTNIKNSILNVRTAMTNAGYSSSQYTIVVQNYESPVPTSGGMRYGQSSFTRQNTGGCGFWDNDVNWANNSALPTINNSVKNGANGAGLSNLKLLDVSTAFNGRRLCENTVGLLEEKGLANWTASGASDQTEWINPIRTASTVFGSYFVQESFHPNYWGGMALRNCARQSFNGGTPRGGVCTRGANGRNTSGEPNMVLT